MKLLYKLDAALVWCVAIILNIAALSPIIFGRQILIPTTGFAHFGSLSISPILSVLSLFLAAWLCSSYATKRGLKIAAVFTGLFFVLGLLFVSLGFAIAMSIFTSFAIRRAKNDKL